jgi:DNA modification methylase
MFSVKGETVLDPFLGSGTITKIAIQNERSSVGYEVDQNLLPVATKKIGNTKAGITLEIIKR